MSWSNKVDHVVFTQNYMDQKTKMDVSEVSKLEQAIDVHGYRGFSKMKHNGVVNIKPEDKELWKSLNKCTQFEQKNIDQKISENGLKHFCDVKVVAHCPNGNRGIGSLYKDNKGELFLVMLGFGNYNHQLF